MKAVIFAGGVGTRLWPLSRKKSPKQFEKVVGDKSTLQLAAEKLFPEFKAEDIYVSTGTNYVDLVKEQLSFIPEENIIAESAKRDVGPAVALVMGYLAKKFPHEPVIILWSDHLVKKVDTFKQIILESCQIIEENPEKIVFIGQKPRFASDNLGWIETGEVIQESGVTFRSFEGFKYRPDKETAEQYFHDKKYCWNLGYFVSTPKFIMSLFERYSPQIYEVMQQITQFDSFPEFTENIMKHYADMPEISFDNAILEQMDKRSAYVVMEDIGWSDVGAWEALKEALEEQRQDNIIKGKVLLETSEDNLVYNYEDTKLIVGVDLKDLLVVNTGDVILVAKKSSVQRIKKLVEGFQGTENEHLT
ncbi:MAG TPA: sugar phosphate nucleotidyltransferase [Candidatus Woesebacteria bacterium]|nr:sugar phosphate nucleotidyltransferase [Candidatus Woesebacteria bacterium]